MKKDMRLAALRRFATAITALTLVGLMVLGFEVSYAYALVSLLTGYSVEIVLETIEAWSKGRKARYRGGLICFINFLLPAHITSLAIAMLLYSNEQLWPIAFASAFANSSKYIFRITIGERVQHFLNPSNSGIALTLILFPWVSITPPYQYTENISGVVNWMMPVFFILFGTFLNARFAKRIPLIIAWLVAFAAQGILRAWYFDTSILPELNIMTGVAFLLFTFYMVEDPGSTPYKPVGQVVFAVTVATLYAMFMILNIVFGLFFALVLTCILRGLYIYILNIKRAKAQPSSYTDPVLVS